MIFIYLSILFYHFTIFLFLISYFFLFIIINKNRCFPCCNIQGHTTKGFCGSPISIKLNVPIERNSPQCHSIDTFWEEGVIYLAEIRSRDTPGLSDTRSIEKVHVLSHTRSKQEKCEPYLRGQITEINTIILSPNQIMKEISIVFNSERCAWHYAWVSHKHFNNTLHIIDVMILIDSLTSNDHYIIAGSFLSPEFSVSSTKNCRPNPNSIKELQKNKNKNRTIENDKFFRDKKKFQIFSPSISLSSSSSLTLFSSLSPKSTSTSTNSIPLSPISHDSHISLSLTQSTCTSPSLSSLMSENSEHYEHDFEQYQESIKKE